MVWPGERTHINKQTNKQTYKHTNIQTNKQNRSFQNWVLYYSIVGPVKIKNNVLVTVPTTCSRPSIEMVDFMYVCMYVFLRVHSPSQTVLN